MDREVHRKLARWMGVVDRRRAALEAKAAADHAHSGRHSDIGQALERARESSVALSQAVDNLKAISTPRSTSGSLHLGARPAT